jgi:hypothetical protein
MTPAMVAALSSGRALVTVFYEFQLPSGTHRLMLGSSEAVWGANTFVGYDPNFGHVDSGEDVRESADGTAPNTSVTIVPSASATRSAIGGPVVQLSPLKMWLAVLTLDGSNKIIAVPDPEPVFDGFIDQSTITLAKGRDEVDYSIISAFDYFFEDSEGQRLNGGFHQSVFAGELGLDNVSGVTKHLYWGATPPPGTRGGNGGSIHGPGSGDGGQTITRVLRGVFGAS